MTTKPNPYYPYTKVQIKSGVIQDQLDPNLFHAIKGMDLKTILFIALNSYGIVAPTIDYDFHDHLSKTLAENKREKEAKKPTPTKPRPIRPQPIKESDASAADMPLWQKVLVCRRKRAVRRCSDCLRYASPNQSTLCPYHMSEEAEKEVAEDAKKNRRL